MSSVLVLAEAYGSLRAKTAAVTALGAATGVLLAEDGSELLGGSVGGAAGTALGFVGSNYQYDPLYRQIFGDKFVDEAYAQANNRLKGMPKIVDNPVGRHASRLVKSYEMWGPDGVGKIKERGFLKTMLSPKMMAATPRVAGRAALLGLGAGLVGAGATQLGLGGEEPTTPEPVVVEEGYFLPKGLALAGVTAAGLTAAGLGANALYNAYNAQDPTIEELSGGSTSLVGVR